MNTIRIETGGTTDLAQVYMWLTRHRGKIIELDRGRRLVFGVPISGARAVIVAVVVQDDAHPGPQMGGVLRALSSRTDAEPVRLVFEGRSPNGRPRSEAEVVAADVLDRISEMIADNDLVAEVA
jgi:hypothetical protein